MKNNWEGHKIQKIKAPYKISVFHTHRHTASLTQTLTAEISLQKTWTEKKTLLRTLNAILFAFTVAIVWKNFENNTKNGWYEEFDNG